MEPDHGDDETQGIEPVSSPPLLLQRSKGPTLGRELVHSMQYYLGVMAIGPVLTWAWWTAHPHHVLLRIAIGLTVIAGLMCLLRFVRGSALDAEYQARVQEKYAMPPTEISDRVLEHIKEGEELLWETRFHPIKLLATWGRQLFGNKIGIMLVLVYAAAVYLIFHLDPLLHVHVPWYVFAAVPLPALGYFGYTIADWRNEKFVVTTQRVLLVRGVFSTRAPEMPKGKITDFEVVVPTFSYFLRWLRLTKWLFGTWQLETAGQWQGVGIVYFIPDPILRKKHLGLAS